MPSGRGLSVWEMRGTGWLDLHFATVYFPRIHSRRREPHRTRLCGPTSPRESHFSGSLASQNHADSTRIRHDDTRIRLSPTLHLVGQLPLQHGLVLQLLPVQALGAWLSIEIRRDCCHHLPFIEYGHGENARPKGRPPWGWDSSIRLKFIITNVMLTYYFYFSHTSLRLSHLHLCIAPQAGGNLDVSERRYLDKPQRSVIAAA
ncbi:hypothetical protein N658DRAFT_264953 [Parathielavia hyrcaniae]|uniref:Uncharacterized protein n=1 Tax=Parathielavia hyrcaniae TaxID=113614 RepID=A0AAN6PYH1_9PEZI|nr:hypothetical protein N658DRAFT_264953 [Parathielavia hyrcaniae]